MIKQKDLEFIKIKKEIVMKDNGKIIKEMVRGQKSGVMVQIFKEIILMDINRVLVNINGLMEAIIMDIGKKT